MSHRIVAMNDAIDSAMTTAGAYSGHAAAGRRRSRRRAGLRQRSPGWRRPSSAKPAACRRPTSSSSSSLAASRDDITALQRDLDDVRRDALLDPLTKMQNRKAFDEGLRRAVDDARSRAGRSA